MKKIIITLTLIVSMTSSVYATIISVPLDQPTIQDGIDIATECDTILVADGIYRGIGNTNILPLVENLVIMSENGSDSTFIICSNEKGFVISSSLTDSTIIQGFTIDSARIGIESYNTKIQIKDCIIKSAFVLGIYCEGGAPLVDNCTITGCYGTGIELTLDTSLITNCEITNNTSEEAGGISFNRYSNATMQNCIISGNTAKHRSLGGSGGGIGIWSSSPRIENCIIKDNIADFNGGGVHCSMTTDYPTFVNCLFLGNQSPDGGAIYISSSTLIFLNCTFVKNISPHGSAFSLSYYAAPQIHDCIIAFNKEGASVLCDDEYPVLESTDIFENEGGDWVGCIASQLDLSDNFSSDPLFCDTAMDNYYLSSTSPCSPAQTASDSLIGAYNVNCISTGIEESLMDLPEQFVLQQNYPNPFNPNTSISFNLPKRSFVKLIIYNLLGQEVIKLVNEEVPSGFHTIDWNGMNNNRNRVVSGVYYYKISTSNFEETKKMILLK